METYNALASFAQTWGMLYFVAAFVAVLVDALAPGRKSQFDAAARQPLRED